MTTITEERALTPAQRQQFIEQGYVHIEGALPREFALNVMREQLAAAKIDPDRPDTWNVPVARLKTTQRWNLREVSPRLLHAAFELLGGADRLPSAEHEMGNNVIANLTTDEDKPWQIPDDNAAWHKDGYFFRHFLDSPEQALLGIVLWSDVVPQGGGTFIAPESIGAVARYLAAHPEGVHPNKFSFRDLIRQCRIRIEATGAAGDVYLMHSYMLHTVSANPRRQLRCIDNSVYALAQPMQFNRSNPADFSPVELAVLRGLGVERYDFKSTRPRVRTPDWGPLPMDQA